MGGQAVKINMIFTTKYDFIMKRSECVSLKTDYQNSVIICCRREDLVSINELLLAIRRLQKVSHDTKLQRIMEVLDQDKDGCIDINNALKVDVLLLNHLASRYHMKQC